MTESEKRSPGRPRSEASRQAILEAAAELITQRGYTSTTIEDIASRAGVGKQTIYRWWPTKADVMLAASAPRAEFAVPVSDRGSYAADLRAFLETAYSMAGEPRTAALLKGLMIEAQARPDFTERFRTLFLQPRREAFAAITQRAAERGDLPAHPAPGTVADIVFGTLWYRLLATGEELDEGLVEDLVKMLAYGPPAASTSEL